MFVDPHLTMLFPLPILPARMKLSLMYFFDQARRVYQLTSSTAATNKHVRIAKKPKSDPLGGGEIVCLLYLEERRCVKGGESYIQEKSHARES